MLKLENALMIGGAALILFGIVSSELIPTLIGFGVLLILMILGRAKPEVQEAQQSVEVLPEVAPVVEPEPVVKEKPKAPKKPRAPRKPKTKQ